MKSTLFPIAFVIVALAGCGGSSQSDQTAAAPDAAEPAGEAPASGAADKAVPDPCAVLTLEEAASLGGTVEAGVENEVAWETIRSCTFDGSGDDFYGVIVLLNTGGLDSAKEMMMGEALPLDDMGMPAFFEMIGDGVGGIGVEKSGVAIHVSPVWADWPAPGSDRAEALKEVARSIAGRL